MVLIETQIATPLTGARTTRIYCRPDCPPGRRTRPENQVAFASAQEARGLGYRPCKVCQPDSQPETFFLSRYQSPLGPYLLVGSECGLVCVEPEEQAQERTAGWQEQGTRVKEQENGYAAQASHELDAYFAGRLRRFTVPLDLRGTPFQRRVWEQLRAIPYGQTRSYGRVAGALEQPTAMRAVGHANGCNPVSIIVPCHRVIGAGGALVGYGGGLERKQALLELEARVLNGQAGLPAR